jgi:endogenous inhibitor of DNA gyrase (YacG/DUF329 family)
VTEKTAQPGKKARNAPACAICGKPVDPKHKPFCSKRCADVDLHRWLNNSYSIAGAPQDEDSAAEDSE